MVFEALFTKTHRLLRMTVFSSAAEGITSSATAAAPVQACSEALHYSKGRHLMSGEVVGVYINDVK